MQAALILDFGGVISRTLFETHASSEQALGLPAGSLTWRGPFASGLALPERDALWESMQRGEISERAYWLTRSAEVGRLLGEDWRSMETLVKRARGNDVQSVLRPEAVAAIAQAKALGCQLAVLSNELDLFYGSGFSKRLPLLRDFDAVIDATYTGILKPDWRAYQACETALGISSDACVFIDDQHRNIVGALAAGWQAIELDVREPTLAFDHALDCLQDLLRG